MSDDDAERFTGRPSEPVGLPRITADDVENMMAALAEIRSHAVELAEHRQAMFKAYVGVGFTDAQALELCRSIP